MFVHVPPPPLSRFVDYLWLQEGAAPAHALESIVPTGTTEIVIALNDTPLRMSGDGTSNALRRVGPTALCGTQSSPFVIDTAPQRSLLGVHFRPGGAFPFFALPAAELRDTSIGLEDLWGSTAAILREQLAAAPTAAARFTVVERTLLARAVRPLARHPAVVHALCALDDTARAVTVASVSQETGLSKRRFIELFDREVGLTPKLFARVRRMQAVLHRIEDPTGTGWAEMALAHGYFDQAHMIRDFRRFTGLTPTAYLARRGTSLNHIVLPPAG